MPGDAEPDEKTRKSTVKHKLVLKKKKFSYYMLASCVLPAMKTPENAKQELSNSDLGRTLYLQKAYRQQYYRMITADPENRWKYTYGLNCPPVGFLVSPVTRSCKNPRICPWCFVRLRLLPILRALKEPPVQFRNLQRVVCWRRIYPYPLHELPFFRADRGPHAWCNASVTAQTLIPFFDGDSGEIVFHHVGIQVVSKEADLGRGLKRNSIYPPLEIQAYDDASSVTIGQAMVATLSFDWLSLYHHNHLQQFITLSDIMEKKQRLLRISRYRT